MLGMGRPLRSPRTNREHQVMRKRQFTSPEQQQLQDQVKDAEMELRRIWNKRERLYTKYERSMAKGEANFEKKFKPKEPMW